MVNGLSSNLNNLHAIDRNNQILNEKINSEIEVEEKKRQREKRFDSFELQEKEKVAGIYDVKKDEQGNIQVIFERPDDSIITKSSDNLKQGSMDKELKSDLLSDEKQKKIEEDGKEGEEPIIMVTTIDSSAVEREIKDLKQQKQQLEQKLASVSEDEKQAIQSELERVRQELNVKDTEAYRRSHDNRRQYVLE